jgi:probable rRNA maturation factor
MYEISVQRVIASKSLPTTAKFKRWATTALKEKIPEAELTIRIVDKTEMTELNHTYRQKNKPTNVLSFPFEMPEELTEETPILGDIIICAEVIEEEAMTQKKSLEAHWAHMVVHGTLHLLGYDHEQDQDADIMEAEEIKILQALGFNNPYQIEGEK